MSEESMCYVAYCRVCGKARLLAVDTGAEDWKDRKDMAREIARALVDGLIVERVTVARARAWPMWCRCGEPGPPTAELFDESVGVHEPAHMEDGS